jgi:hypothetical protein
MAALTVFFLGGRTSNQVSHTQKDPEIIIFEKICKVKKDSCVQKHGTLFYKVWAKLV